MASDDAISKTIENLKSRGFDAVIVGSKSEAIEKLKELIPAGADVMTGGSTTLKEIGFTQLLESKNHK